MAHRRQTLCGAALLGCLGASPAPSYEAVDCAGTLVPPPSVDDRFVLARGDADSKSHNVGEATHLAFVRARARLLSSASCDEGTNVSPRCARIASWTRDWGAGSNPRGTSVCAVVLVRESVLHAGEVELQRFESEVAALAGRIRAEAGRRKIRIDAPVWSASGCVAGEIGAALSGRIGNALGAPGGPTLVASGPADLQISLDLAVIADTLTVAAWIGAPGGPRTAIAGFTVPASLFDLEPAEAGACRGRLALGVPEVAAGKVRAVTVDVDTTGGLLCEKQPTRARIGVDQPSWVRVYSVLDDGTAWQVWPVTPGEGRVDRELALGPLEGAILPGHRGDESLVAVAVPLADGAAPAAGFCRVSRWSMPANAASAMATFRVVAGRGCPSVDPDGAAALLTEFQHAPECP